MPTRLKLCKERIDKPIGAQVYWQTLRNVQKQTFDDVKGAIQAPFTIAILPMIFRELERRHLDAN